MYHALISMIIEYSEESGKSNVVISLNEISIFEWSPSEEFY